jgi:hypothetical protein
MTAVPYWRENPTLTEALLPGGPPPYPREPKVPPGSTGGRLKCSTCLAVNGTSDRGRRCGRCGVGLHSATDAGRARADTEPRPLPSVSESERVLSLSEADLIIACAETIEADLRDPVAVHALWTAASRCIEAADERDRERAERARRSQLWRGSVSAAGSMLKAGVG